MNNITLIPNETNQYIFSSFCFSVTFFDDLVSHQKDAPTSKTKIRKFQVKFSLDSFFFFSTLVIPDPCNLFPEKVSKTPKGTIVFSYLSRVYVYLGWKLNEGSFWRGQLSVTEALLKAPMRKTKHSLESLQPLLSESRIKYWESILRIWK